jgi:NADP-dependent 3-hydroxy acid dehydrogenase YdfG
MAESARKELRERGIRVTLISPGNVDTPFFDNAPTVALTDDDVARAVMFAADQPPGVGINEILLRHRDQEI